MTYRTPTLIILSLLALAGCASVEPAATDVVPATEVATDALPADVPAPASAAPEEVAAGAEMGPDAALFGGEHEPDVRPEDFEEGFCADDIYAKYLTARYHAEHANDPRPKAVVSHRHRRRGHHARRGRDNYAKNLSEFAALSYAHQVMAGRVSPYFGAIPIVTNDKVDFWVQYFKTSGRKVFMRWLVRGETLKRTVQPLLQESGVPMEFFYLAMIESGLSNKAYSHARASGTWQFMRGTAQLYGLKIDRWVDERRDPMKSTVAAANYLKDLYEDLGDWHLAMAAYNAGPGKVRKALKRNSNADFWHLCDTADLAKETKEYVPKVLAAVLLAADAKGQGFEVQANTSDDLPTNEVLVKRPTRLKQIAAQLGMPLSTLSAWNPELVRGVTPPTKHGYALRLSERYADLYPSIESKLAAVDTKDIHIHKVRRGETLSRIARRYKIPVQQIIAVNPDLGKERLQPGSSIAIPAKDLAVVGDSKQLDQGILN